MNPKKPTRQGEALRYSAIGVQMVAMILICVWGGWKLDRHFETQTPWFTLGLSVLGMVAALIYVIRRVL
jgi:F0F1-type ATP synthase assembly protein I